MIFFSLYRNNVDALVAFCSAILGNCSRSIAVLGPSALTWHELAALALQYAVLYPQLPMLFLRAFNFSLQTKNVANTQFFSAQACLNAPEPTPGNENGVDGPDQVDSPEESAAQHMPPQGGRPGMPQNPHMPGNYMPNMPMDPQQALAYQNYVQQRNQGYGSGMPPQGGMPPSNHHQS